MKITPNWLFTKDQSIINTIAIDPVHDKCIIGINNQIYYIDTITGKEQALCEKHKNDITCLAFRKDGLWFASGS